MTTTKLSKGNEDSPYLNLTTGVCQLTKQFAQVLIRANPLPAERRTETAVLDHYAASIGRIASEMARTVLGSQESEEDGNQS